MKLFFKVSLISLAVVFFFAPLAAWAYEVDATKYDYRFVITDSSGNRKIVAFVYNNNDYFPGKASGWWYGIDRSNGFHPVSEASDKVDPNRLIRQLINNSGSKENGVKYISDTWKMQEKVAEVETKRITGQTDEPVPEPEAPVNYGAFTPVLNVKIGPNVVTFPTVSCTEGEDCEIPWIGQYFKVLYQYGVGLAAMLAAIMIMIGGFLWLASAGSPDRVKTGKELITGALSGLVLALFSFLILFTINPELVNLKPLVIRTVKPIDIEKMAASKAPGAAAAAAAAGCPDASKATAGFPALITSYCHPKPEDYKTLDDYCCAAEMNCSCPGSGKHDTSKSCPGGRHPCADCNATIPICTKTSSGVPPSSDIVAGDYSCFSEGSKVCIGGKTYTVGDEGQWVKGAHFDVFNENCADAIAVGGGSKTVTTGACQ